MAADPRTYESSSLSKTAWISGSTAFSDFNSTKSSYALVSTAFSDLLSPHPIKKLKKQKNIKITMPLDLIFLFASLIF